MADVQTGLALMDVSSSVSRRALLLEPNHYDPASLARLAAAGVTTDCTACATQDKLVRYLSQMRQQGQEVQVMFGRLGLAFDATVFEAAGPELRWLVTPTTGHGHIDEAELSRRGIRLLSLRGHLEFLRTVSSTAELTWAMLLALVRWLPAAHADVLAGQWRRQPFMGREVRGKTLGILGLGRLGTLVAGYAKAFQMRVLAWDQRDEAFAELAISGVERCDLNRLLSECDVLSLHLSLTERTEGLLNRERLARMKAGAWIINTARGELIDEMALLAALECGALAGAALDVLHGDSRWAHMVPEDHPLITYARGHSNLLLTPHLGGYSLEAIDRTRRFMVERFCEEIS